MKMPARLLPVVLLCAFLPFSACSKTKGDASDAKKDSSLQLPPPSVRPPAPPWTLKTAEGKTLSLADFKGKIVVLNFWATWCPPCRAELPEFGVAAKAYAPRGVEFVGLSVDNLMDFSPEGDVKQIAPMSKTLGIEYPSVLATDKTLADYGGITSIPQTFFVDRQGRVVGRVEGMIDGKALHRVLDALVAEQAPAPTAPPAAGK